jgi:hypothetical protein
MLGRAAHHYASSKLRFLQLALDNLVSCNMSLPLIPVPEDSWESEFGSSGTWTSSPASADTGNSSMAEDIAGSVSRIIELSLEALAEDDPFISLEALNQEDASCSFELPKQSLKLIPSPLRIRKLRQQDDENPLKDSSGSPIPPRVRTRTQPFSLPLKIIASWNYDSFTLQSEKEQNQLRNFHGFNNISSTFKQELTFTPRRAKAIRRYKNLVLSFGAQLRSNISTVSFLIAHVTELQQIHRTTRCPRSMSFWSFRPVEATRKEEEGQKGRYSSFQPDISNSNSYSFAIPGALCDETKQQRISRLRSECWNTVGPKNPRRGWKGGEYYEKFCSQVLNDICFAYET